MQIDDLKCQPNTNINNYINDNIFFYTGTLNLLQFKMIYHLAALIIILIIVTASINVFSGNLTEFFSVLGLAGYFVNFIINGAGVLQWGLKGQNPSNALLRWGDTTPAL